MVSSGPATVLFACIANAGRSQMSAALFNAYADPAKARGISAGTQPGSTVHPVCVTVMNELDIDISNNTPQRLTSELAQQAALLVTMGCGETCPYVPGLEKLDWPLSDPKHMPVEGARQVRDDAAARVRQLIQERGWGKAE